MGILNFRDKRRQRLEYMFNSIIFTQGSNFDRTVELDHQALVTSGSSLLYLTLRCKVYMLVQLDLSYCNICRCQGEDTIQYYCKAVLDRGRLNHLAGFLQWVHGCLYMQGLVDIPVLVITWFSHVPVAQLGHFFRVQTLFTIGGSSLCIAGSIGLTAITSQKFLIICME